MENRAAERLWRLCMKAVYAGAETKIIDACAFTNSLAANPAFWEAIRAKAQFDYTDLSPAEIARRLREADATITVKLWKPPFGRYRNTVAVTDRRHPHTLFYNQNKLHRSTADIVNTIVHEYVHNVDYFADGHDQIEFGHGSQVATAKEESAPYWIGELAETLYRSAHSTPKAKPEPLEHEEVEVSPDEIVD